MLKVWHFRIYCLYAMEKLSGTPKLIELKDCYDYEAVCPHDSLWFKSEEEWKSHHLANHMDTKWKCPLCGVESKSWYNYSFHVQIEKHQSVCVSPWICKLDYIEKPHSDNAAICCGARYGSKHQLIRHIRDFHRNYRVELMFRNSICIIFPCVILVFCLSYVECECGKLDLL